MSNETKPLSPLANLSAKQQDRLKELSGSLSVDKITVSHSLEERSRDGRKSSVFYSVTASRGAGAELPQLANDHHSPVGFSPADTKLARLVLAKHVVASVYDDAVKRGLMPSSAAQEELRAILTRYDASIAKVLGSEDP